MEQNCAVFSIKDELCRRTGLTAKWVNGSTLAISAYNPITCSTKDRESEFSGQHDVNIFYLQPDFIYEEPILRSLISEANSIFLTLQKLGKNGQLNDYIKISRTYRSIIRACLDKLQNVTQSTDITDDERTKYENYITIFYSVECVWHLCEILFIDPLPSNIVVPQLLEWIRFHFPSYERIATDLLLYGRDANINDDYWPTIKGLILQGQIDVARAILQLHSLSETSAFKMAEQILKTMPIYNIYGGVSVQKFRSQWQYWLDDTELKLSAGIFSTEPELEEIIKLITGNRNVTVWNELLRSSEYWYEYFPGYLFYTEPACKHYELGTLANCWLTRWANIKGFDDDSSFLKHLDRVILNLMENDMHQVLLSIQKMCDNQWFVTHLTDLLYHCGKLSVIGENKKNEAINLRNALLFEFGSILMSRESLWMLGIDYLEYSFSETNEGIGAIEIMLPRIPIKCEKQALKIISIAKTRNLTKVEQEICKIQAKQSMISGRYGNALEWAVRSNDTHCVTTIADFFLNHYSQTGEMLCPDILSNIGAKMFVSPRLVFLIKYYDFHHFYKMREFIPAAKLLVNLLDSKITPEYFWPSLLIDTIPLLESKDPKIPSKETCIILHHLESALIPLVEKKKKQMQQSPEKHLNLLKDYRIENIEEIIKLIRLACARNLSRAIILENTVIS